MAKFKFAMHFKCNLRISFVKNNKEMINSFHPPNWKKLSSYVRDGYLLKQILTDPDIAGNLELMLKAIFG